MASTITVNGKTITIPSGHCVSVVNGIVKVDGKVYGGEDFASNVMEIKITAGTIENLVTDKSVTCYGVTGNVSAGGSVNCDDVKGDVKAGGSVNCDNIGGNVTAGGSIMADAIQGRRL